MMKWWGWGAYEVSFRMDEKPLLWHWILEKLRIREVLSSPAIEKSRLRFDPPRSNPAFTDALSRGPQPIEFLSDDDSRLHHATGKSYRNLILARQGRLRRLPDVVILPTSHNEVERIVSLANEHDVCLIPFGGGTNIVGGVDPVESGQRLIASLDMRKMNRVVEIDRYSMVALIEAGASGPELEAQLQTVGLSLGHAPDSFEFSTLGGWIATRSTGMQSDAYGRIEDMVLSASLVTPTGTLQTRTVPASSSGPDLNRIIAGSEGVLGVITQARMQVHETPAARDYRGLLFRCFADGVRAIHDCIREGVRPSLIRLQDEAESELAFKMRSPPTGIAALAQTAIRSWLKYRGYQRPCIMVIGFEGTEADVRYRRKSAIAIMKRHGGLGLGRSVGATWSKDKYNIPYLRDYLMDHGIMCDVSETSACWDKIVDVHQKTIAAAEEVFAADHGGCGYIGCHISHTYETGACLYFTYATRQNPGNELEQYDRYKRRITDVFMTEGATLTHHHAVGSEHLPWMGTEISPRGVETLRALKRSFDPRNIMNPGKLIPDVDPAR